ncbi:MAG TPA: metal-dependent hydrolase [Waterburya sp.]|jgi:hypothetical protein
MVQSITPQIEVRRKNFNFSEDINRYWCGHSAFKTHFLNSLTLFLPEAEQYLIRIMGQRLKFLNKSQLKHDALAFVGQEAQHSIQHTKFWDNLRASDYKIDSYLRLVRTVFFQIFERRLSNSLNLAIGAAGEHLTTLFAELILEGEFLAESETNLRHLFEWHAVEEIEHKSVIFDVLQNTNNSYPLRLVGLVVSHLLVFGFLNLGLAILLYQDKKLLDKQVWQEMFQFWFSKEQFLKRVLLNCRKYCDKNFHPSQTDHLFLLKNVMVSG